MRLKVVKRTFLLWVSQKLKMGDWNHLVKVNIFIAINYKNIIMIHPLVGHGGLDVGWNKKQNTLTHFL